MYALLKRDFSQKAIAGDTGQVSRSTVSRELRRNRDTPGHLENIDSSYHNHLLVIGAKKACLKPKKMIPQYIIFWSRSFISNGAPSRSVVLSIVAWASRSAMRQYIAPYKKTNYPQKSKQEI
jgi:hypothetical protein